MASHMGDNGHKISYTLVILVLWFISFLCFSFHQILLVHMVFLVHFVHTFTWFSVQCYWVNLVILGLVLSRSSPDLLASPYSLDLLIYMVHLVCLVLVVPVQ